MTFSVTCGNRHSGNIRSLLISPASSPLQLRFKSRWIDTEFILISIDTKNSMKQQELAEIAIFAKWAILAKMQRGHPLQDSRNWPFFAELC